MPSDQSGAIPKGTLIRGAPDWFDDNMGCGSAYFPLSTPGSNFLYVTAALFNNANTGIKFKVYGVSASADGGGGYGLFFVKGTIGSFVMNCQSIDPTLPAPYGQIYFQSMNGATVRPNDFYTGQFFAQIGTPGFDSGTFFSEFPIAIVPAGYSLVATNTSTTGMAGFGFWFQQANE